MHRASAHSRLQHPSHGDIDSDAKDVFGFLLKSDHIEKGPFGRQVDEEVDVALSCVLSTCDGPEYSEIANAAAAGRRQESVSSPADEREPMTGGSSSRTAWPLRRGQDKRPVARGENPLERRERR